MSFIKTYLITAALGLAVAGGVSLLSLHENMNRGNGSDMTASQPGRSAHFGNNLHVSAEPTVHAEESPFGRSGAFDN